MENMGKINKKIIFCFPYRGTGGVSLLFLRLANQLRLLNFNVAIIDYIDGFMSLNNKNDIEFIEYKDYEHVNILGNSILILQSLVPWSIYPALRISRSTNLFFITTIPINLYPALPIVRDKMLKGGFFAKMVWMTILKDEHNKVKKFIDLGIKKDSIVFLDADIVCNLINTLSLGLSNAKIIPLFSENTVENSYLKKNKLKITNELIVGWVGRIADFKIHILNRVIEDLKKFSENNDIRIRTIIIGKGERESNLLDYNTENFKIERIDYIDPDTLHEQLLKFDLYFAMGTAALDGARLGVPTVRLDYSFEKVNKGYKYKFLFDVNGYSLGELIGSKCYNKGIYSMSELINKAEDDIAILSHDTFIFYQKNHSLSNATKLFIDFVENSKLNWGDIVNANILDSRLYNLWKKIRK
jgi:hypothetical protein